MIQDIAPHKLDNAFRPCAPRKEDRILLFDANGNVMGKEDVSIDATEAVVETDLNSDGSYDIFDIMLSKVSDETEVDTDAVNETIMNKIMTKEA